MKILVGYTGFVGSNICEQSKFDMLVNSKNVETAYGTNPELLIYSGVPAEMFTANTNPAKDKEITDNAFENICRINPERVVLISTVAVYDELLGVDEDREIDATALTPYGRNRLELERRVEKHFKNHLIVRLPAIYGLNLKKNFIYDYLSYSPALLKKEKYEELSAESELVKTAYVDRGDGFYKNTVQDETLRKVLREEFKRLRFCALNFTDSRCVYQFLSLKHLMRAIEGAGAAGIRKINLVPEPVCVSEVYEYLTGEVFTNITDKPIINYDLRTKHTQSGYVMSKEQELLEIKEYIESYSV